MKKKIMYLLFVALIAANVFYSTTPTTGKKSVLKLEMLQARADEPGEVDPKDEFPPRRLLPIKWSLSAIIEYFL